MREAEVREERRSVEDEQAALHQNLEQRVRELTALNRMFEEHQQQRAEIGNAARALFESSQNMTEDVGRLAELTSDDPSAALRAIQEMDSSEGGAAAAQ